MRRSIVGTTERLDDRKEWKIIEITTERDFLVDTQQKYCLDGQTTSTITNTGKI